MASDREALPRLSASDWIRKLDAIRANDELLRRGYWHAYTMDEPSEWGIMRGYYCLVRWERPNVAVAHDDRDTVIDLARKLEEAVGGAL